MPESLSKQLAAAVSRIRWSYAIFWSFSCGKPGILEWGDGYYNGEIKTRKTVQAVELDESEIGLQRSEHLRELYISLCMGETSEPTRRLASLSPEDLTPTEWYYLVCMTFSFTIGQGLPGQALETGQFRWVDDAQSADRKHFGRSLLAKSASIQTVIAFPFLEGVLELGITERVHEDPSLIERIKSTFFMIRYAIVGGESCCPAPDDGPVNHGASSADVMVDYDILEGNGADPIAEFEEIRMDDSAHGDHSESMKNEAPQLHTWYFGSDELSSGNLNSVTSSDCVSQTLVDVGKHEWQLMEPLDDHLQTENRQYRIILETLSKSSWQLLLGPYSANRQSCFVHWGGGRRISSPKTGGSQKLLKRILFDAVQLMIRGGPTIHASDDGIKDELWKPEADESGTSHALSERRLNEKFTALGSLIPMAVRTTDKVSILDETIAYLKKMKEGASDLECRSSNGCAVPGDVVLSLTPENDGVIRIRCPWKDHLLLSIIDVLTRLRLDSHSVRSSNVDGILSLTIEYKLQRPGSVSMSTLRQVLRRTITALI